MIYTIGYAGTTIERFLQVLKNNKITILIDVRSIPKSKYFEWFDDNNLSKSLKNIGVKYENWKIEFGARQLNRVFYSDDKILDYTKFAQSIQFQNGIKKIKNLTLNHENICLMCAEIDPMNCHRAILCGKEIFSCGLDVTHIICKRNGETYLETQETFEKRLLETTNSNNPSRAYQIQNKKIGYKLI